MDHSFASSIAGYLSIACWLIVFTPQLWENYARKSGDGLSMTFLIIWLAGDVFNLLGVIMQDLLVTMFLLALYYTLADMCLIWQVIYYEQHKKSDVKEGDSPSETSSLLNHESSSSNRSTKDSRKVQLFNFISALSIVLVTLVSCYTYIKSHGKHNENNLEEEDEHLQFLPQLMGWTSAIFYIGSRIPQIMKNWKHKSTEGLSLGMFLCAVMGNIFFTMSIFLKSTNMNYILMNLSWIVGSCGTLVFDFTIFIQFFVYKNTTKVTTMV